MKRKEERPPGGRWFEAVRIAPDGWLCLAPWVQTPDGHWWRPHIEGCQNYGEVSRKWAEHMATAINEAMARGASGEGHDDQ